MYTPKGSDGPDFYNIFLHSASLFVYQVITSNPKTQNYSQRIKQKTGSSAYT